MRASGIFVGTYFEAGDTSFVKIDGTTFREPISVGDPGAKGAKLGDKVALEIVRYPTPYLDGEGVITDARWSGPFEGNVGRCIAAAVRGRRVANVDTGSARADVPLTFRAR